MNTSPGRWWWFFGVNLVFLVFFNRERRLRFVTQTHFPCGKSKGVGGVPLLNTSSSGSSNFFSVYVLGFAFIPTARVLTIVARVDFSGSSFVPPSPPCSLIYRCVCMCVFTDGAFLPVFERLKKETKNG